MTPLRLKEKSTNSCTPLIWRKARSGLSRRDRRIFGKLVQIWKLTSELHRLYWAPGESLGCMFTETSCSRSSSCKRTSRIFFVRRLRRRARPWLKPLKNCLRKNDWRITSFLVTTDWLAWRSAGPITGAKTGFWVRVFSTLWVKTITTDWDRCETITQSTKGIKKTKNCSCSK